MENNVIKIGTNKQVNEDRVLKVAKVISKIAPDLEIIICFGKYKDGAFCSMTANMRDPATLGYAQSQVIQISLEMAEDFDLDATPIDID